MEKKGRRKSRSKSQGDLADSKPSHLSLVSGRKEYEDGIYEGQLLRGLRHGKGLMKGKNGFVFFEGNWENDKPNGYGMMKFPNTGDRHEGNYQDGRRDGLGVFLWSNGDKYSGHFKSGAMHGYGRFEWACGDVYTGDFSEGHAHGDGFKIYADGRRSYGMFEHSKEQGWIKQVFPNGDTYSGFIDDGRIDRFGCFDWMTGDRYEGEWKDEFFHGVGSYTAVGGNRGSSEREITQILATFSQGEPEGVGYYQSNLLDFEYYGEFKKDKEELTWGHLEYENGIQYDGDTLDFNRHGLGQLSYCKTPLMFSEDVEPFEAEKLNTFGDLLECIRSFGVRFVGHFEDDIPHGVGELLFPDNQVVAFKFSHGVIDQ